MTNHFSLNELPMETNRLVISLFNGVLFVKETVINIAPRDLRFNEWLSIDDTKVNVR